MTLHRAYFITCDTPECKETLYYRKPSEALREGWHLAPRGLVWVEQRGWVNAPRPKDACPMHHAVSPRRLGLCSASVQSSDEERPRGRRGTGEIGAA